MIKGKEMVSVRSPLEVIYQDGELEDFFDLAPYFKDIQYYDRDPNNYPCYVDLYADTDYLQEYLGALARAYAYYGNTHVISALNDMDKYSRYYADCIGIVLMGKDQETEKDLSVLTHQDVRSSCIDKDWAPGFKHDLDIRLNEIVKRCGDSISVCLFGGYLDSNKDDIYKEGISFFIEFFADKLGISPQILAFPNKKGEKLDVFLETKKGMLSLFGATFPHLLTKVEFTSDMIDDFVEKRRLELFS